MARFILFPSHFLLNTGLNSLAFPVLGHSDSVGVVQDLPQYTLLPPTMAEAALKRLEDMCSKLGGMCVCVQVNCHHILGGAATDSSPVGQVCAQAPDAV